MSRETTGLRKDGLAVDNIIRSGGWLHPSLKAINNPKVTDFERLFFKFVQRTCHLRCAHDISFEILVPLETRMMTALMRYTY